AKAAFTSALDSGAIKLTPQIGIFLSLLGGLLGAGGGLYAVVRKSAQPAFPAPPVTTGPMPNGGLNIPLGAGGPMVSEVFGGSPGGQVPPPPPPVPAAPSRAEPVVKGPTETVRWSTVAVPSRTPKPPGGAPD